MCFIWSCPLMVKDARRDLCEPPEASGCCALVLLSPLGSGGGGRDREGDGMEKGWG